MPNFGVAIAILDGDTILLTQREDFEVWCLPGGSVEDGETLAETARREAREETGLEVRIERLVGVYSNPKWANGGSHEFVFAATPLGGALSPDPREVKAAAWFRIDDLPEPILPWMVRQIREALSGVGGSAAWRQEYTWPFPPGMSRREVYRLRDESGLARQEFFLQYARQVTLVESSELKDHTDSGGTTD